MTVEDTIIRPFQVGFPRAKLTELTIILGIAVLCAAGHGIVYSIAGSRNDQEGQS
jgi:hypothetical protein